MRVLVIRVDHLGDLVLTTPLFRALAQAGHRVEVVCRKSTLPVLTGNPHIAGYYAIEDIAPGFPSKWWMLSRWIRILKPDLILLPHARTFELCLAVRVGHFGRIIAMWGGWTGRLFIFDNLRSQLFSNTRHMTDICLDMARAIGCADDGLQPEIFLTPEERTAADEDVCFRFGNRKVVIVHPGCAGNTCNFPLGVYRQIIQQLLSGLGVVVIVTGSIEEKSVFGDSFKNFDPAFVWNAMGEFSLRKLCAVIDRSDALVSVGTGPLHIATAVGTPAVAPFCRRTGVSKTVWGNTCQRSVHLEPPLSFCLPDKALGHCDFGGTITAESVVLAVRQILIQEPKKL